MVELDSLEGPYVYECKTCNNIVLASKGSDLTCCGGGMIRIQEDEIPEGIREPDLKSVLRDVFGMSDVEKEMCVYLMEEGDSTVPELAESFGLDRSGVSRYVNHLVDIGIFEKSTKNLKKGGYINVYSHASPKEVERIFKIGLYAWTSDAMKEIEKMNQEKLKAVIEEGNEEGASTVYWDN